MWAFESRVTSADTRRTTPRVLREAIVVTRHERVPTSIERGWRRTDAQHAEERHDRADGAIALRAAVDPGEARLVAQKRLEIDHELVPIHSDDPRSSEAPVLVLPIPDRHRLTDDGRDLAIATRLERCVERHRELLVHVMHDRVRLAVAIDVQHRRIEEHALHEACHRDRILAKKRGHDLLRELREVLESTPDLLRPFTDQRLRASPYRGKLRAPRLRGQLDELSPARMIHPGLHEVQRNVPLRKRQYVVEAIGLILATVIIQGASFAPSRGTRGEQ